MWVMVRASCFFQVCRPGASACPIFGVNIGFHSAALFFSPQSICAKAQAASLDAGDLASVAQALEPTQFALLAATAEANSKWPQPCDWPVSLLRVCARAVCKGAWP